MLSLTVVFPFLSFMGVKYFLKGGFPCGNLDFPCSNLDFPCGNLDFPCGNLDFPWGNFPNVQFAKRQLRVSQ